MDNAAAWLARSLDYQFADPGLLKEALTHRSATGQSNERLEFLGDAVLDFVISAEVYGQRPDANEGDLSRFRASLVNDASLAELAAELGVGEYIKLGGGEKKTGGHRRSSILADTLEALFGAVYLDRGFAAAETLILHVYRERLAKLPESGDLRDPKTKLQEYLQGSGFELPDYDVSEVSGKPHRRRFVVTCKAAALNLESNGEGTSRRIAEQNAAREMLTMIKAHSTDS